MQCYVASTNRPSLKINGLSSRHLFYLFQIAQSCGYLIFSVFFKIFSLYNYQVFGFFQHLILLLDFLLDSFLPRCISQTGACARVPACALHHPSHVSFEVHFFKANFISRATICCLCWIPSFVITEPGRKRRKGILRPSIAVCRPRVQYQQLSFERQIDGKFIYLLVSQS